MNNPNIDATLLSVVSKQIMSKTYFMKAVATQIPVIIFRAITFDEGLYIIQSNGMTLYEGCEGAILPELWDICSNYSRLGTISVILYHETLTTTWAHIIFLDWYGKSLLAESGIWLLKIGERGKNSSLIPFFLFIIMKNWDTKSPILHKYIFYQSNISVKEISSILSDFFFAIWVLVEV